MQLTALFKMTFVTPAVVIVGVGKCAFHVKEN